MKRIRRANNRIYDEDEKLEELEGLKDDYKSELLHLSEDLEELDKAMDGVLSFYRGANLKEMYELLELSHSYEDYRDHLEKILEVKDDVWSLYSMIKEDVKKLYGWD